MEVNDNYKRLFGNLLGCIRFLGMIAISVRLFFSVGKVAAVIIDEWRRQVPGSVIISQTWHIIMPCFKKSSCNNLKDSWSFNFTEHSNSLSLKQSKTTKSRRTLIFFNLKRTRKILRGLEETIKMSSKPLVFPIIYPERILEESRNPSKILMNNELPK